MKTIKIKSLKLTNFKGIRSLEISELSDQTFVYGDNGVGKTTLFDAFTWLLFGKDSSDRKDFEIKTLDKNNNVIPKIDHEVEARIEVNGEPIHLRRIFKEKWVKQKGALEAVFTGNETNYEWNGVPMNAGEYSAKISNIVDEKVFKLITSTTAFNSLKWQEQRDVLIMLSGNITDADVAKGDAEFEELIANLNGVSLDERKREVKASITKSKNDLKTIPTRIDEVERSKPEPKDFDLINKMIEEHSLHLETVNNQITDKLQANQAVLDKQMAIKNEIQQLEIQINDVKHRVKMKARQDFQNQNSGADDLKFKIDNKQKQIISYKNALESLKSQLEHKKVELTQTSEKIVALRGKWQEVNSQAFDLDEIEDCCPTCGQSLPEEQIAAKRTEILKVMTNAKVEKLKSIDQEGLALKKLLESLTVERDDLKKRIDDGLKVIQDNEAELQNMTSNIPDQDLPKESEENIYNRLIALEDLQTAQSMIEAKNKDFANIVQVDVSDLKAKRDELQGKINDFKIQLNDKNITDQANKRIGELLDQEKQLAQTIADLEKKLYIIESFEKQRSNRIEEAVNNRFSLVNFKLFETQINGSEVPTCKALINGVPFSDANTASKINAGIDIINTLCNHFQATAPIFIDNRESVVELIPTQSQVINLVVSEQDKKLRVECLSMAESV